MFGWNLLKPSLIPDRLFSRSLINFCFLSESTDWFFFSSCYLRETFKILLPFYPVDFFFYSHSCFTYRLLITGSIKYDLYSHIQVNIEKELMV